MSWRAAFVAVALGACVGDELPATQVVVVVGGDERVDRLDVGVYAPGDVVATSRLTIDLRGRTPPGLPTSFVVVPAARGGGDAFQVVVQGARRAQGDTLYLARGEAIARFVQGETVVLPVVLSAACADERCACPVVATCAKTCVATREGEPECVDVPTYGELPRISPGDELGALERGLSGCERGSFPGSDGTCADLDECAFGLDACTRTPNACVNDAPGEGRYHCACPPAFAGTGEADDPCVCEGGACESD